jgi:hypothetical protein
VPTDTADAFARLQILLKTFEGIARSMKRR